MDKLDNFQHESQTFQTPNTPISTLSDVNCHLNNKKLNSSLKVTENIVIENFIVSFKYIPSLRKKANFHLHLLKPMCSNGKYHNFSLNIYSNFFRYILDFPYVFNIYTLWLPNSNEKDTLEESRLLFEELLHQISSKQNNHFLTFFSFSKLNRLCNAFKFNISFHFFLIILSDLELLIKKDSKNSIKNLFVNLLSKCPLPEDLQSEITNLFETVNDIINLDLPKEAIQRKVIPSYISFPLISLIYFESKNQTNVTIKNCLIQIWEKIKAKKDQITRKNLAKFYQLEFFKEICVISNKITEAYHFDEKSIEKIFFNLNNLINDFAFISQEFPCRILRQQNFAHINKFLTALEGIETLNLTEASINFIYKCIFEAERFFHLHCLIYLVDFSTEFTNQNLDNEKIEILQDSWEVVDKLIFILRFHKFKKYIQESLPRNLLSKSETSSELLDSDLLILKKWEKEFEEIKKTLDFTNAKKIIDEILSFLTKNTSLLGLTEYSPMLYPYSGYKIVRFLDTFDYFIQSDNVSMIDFEILLKKEGRFELRFISDFFKNNGKRSLADQKLLLRKYNEYSICFD